MPVPSVPPKPDGQPGTSAWFGAVMKWGHSPEKADAAIPLLTVEHLEHHKVTIEILHAWRDFYLHESQRVRHNRNALPRVRVLEHAIQLLSSELGET